MKAKIYVKLKKGVHDPQGEAVSHALKSMGYSEVDNVRIGKYIELDLKAQSGSDERARINEMCEKLLANTVIESYEIEA